MDTTERPLMERPAVWWAMIVVAAAGLFGVYYWMQVRPAPAPPVAAAPPAPPKPAAAPAAPAPAPDAIQHPIEQAPAAEALPALDQSDEPLRAALAGLIGARAVRDYIIPAELIHRIVATIDNLPRTRAAVELWPIKPVGGGLTVAKGETTLAIGADNAKRYTPYVVLAEAVDPAKLAAVYVHFYPLFQSAYRELGYPNGYFNDRLIVALDDLLAAPEVAQPVALVAPHAMFQYADPQLEALSAGQKVMIRIGPANEERIKARVRALRAVLVHEKPAG
jgi:hypothetical protein